MKALLLSQIFPPHIGGSGRWLWELYRRMPGDYVVVAGETPGQEAFDQESELAIHRMPLTLPSWGLLHSQARQTYGDIRRRLTPLLEAHAITSLHVARALPEGLLALGFQITHKLPYTVFVHGEELHYAAASRELRFLTRRVLRNANHIIANSQNTRRILLGHWVPASAPIIVLHPGVDTQDYTPARRNLEVRSRLDWQDRPVVLTVGRLQQRKGQDRLIEAIPAIRQTIPDVLYAIVGDGEDRPRLQAIIDRLELNHHVQLLGSLDDDATRVCYQQCDLFALPNRQVGSDIEGFGIVLLEAQACGKPVIAGDSGGTAETMDVGKTGLIVDCTRPELLAKAVTELLLDSPRREAMGQAARAWVVEHFDWERLASQAATLFGLDLVDQQDSNRQEYVSQ